MALLLLAATAQAGTPWIPFATLLLTGVVAGGVAYLAARVVGRAEVQRVAESLEAIAKRLDEVGDGGSKEELRRVEHALLDIRDGQRKFSDAILRLAETGAATSADPVVAGGGGGGSLEERVVNRLFALGYERVEIARATWPEDEEAEPEPTPEDAEEGSFELRVEARRQGVLHKGKVQVRDGRIQDVTMKPSYSVFP